MAVKNSKKKNVPKRVIASKKGKNSVFRKKKPLPAWGNEEETQSRYEFLLKTQGSGQSQPSSSKKKIQNICPTCGADTGDRVLTPRGEREFKYSKESSADQKATSVPTYWGEDYEGRRPRVDDEDIFFYKKTKSPVKRKKNGRKK